MSEELTRYQEGRVCQDLSTKVVGALAWIAVFLPGHLLGWMVERFFVVLIVISALFVVGRPTPTRLYKGVVKRKLIIITIALSISTISYFAGSLISVIVKDYAFGIRDFIDLLRYMIFALVAVIVSTANPLSIYRVFISIIIASNIFILIVFFLYVVHIPIISDVVMAIYSETKTGVNFPSWVRISVPFENPNFLAYYLLLCLSFVMFFMSGKSRPILMFLCVISLLLTGSRSGWAAAIILFLGFGIRSFVGIMVGNNRRVRRQHAYSLFIFLLAVSVGAYLLFPVLAESSRIQVVVSAVETSGGIQDVGSVAGRLRMTRDAFSLALESPIFGWGPLKDGALGIIDNQYVLLFGQIGMVGSFSLISVVIILFYEYIKSISGAVGKIDIVIIFMSVALMLATGSFLFSFRLLFISFFFLVAIEAELWKRRTATWT